MSQEATQADAYAFFINMITEWSTAELEKSLVAFNAAKANPSNAYKFLIEAELERRKFKKETE